MSQEGYVKIWRKALENSLWNEGPFDPWHAWQYLIMKAAWRPHRVRFRGTSLTLRRGQLATTLRTLQKDWQWSCHKVVGRFLDRLKDDLMISVEGGYWGTPQKSGQKSPQQSPQSWSKSPHLEPHPFFVVTLLNFDGYQNVLRQEPHPAPHPPPKIAPPSAPGEKKYIEEKNARASNASTRIIEDPGTQLENMIARLSPDAARTTLARYDSLGWPISEELRERLLRRAEED